MNKPVLAVDIDEVLIPYRPAFHEFFKQTRDPDITLAEFRSMLGSLLKESAYFDLLDEFVASGNKEWSAPILGAVESIEKLLTKYEVDIVTARHNESRQGTDEWLARHFPKVFRNVHFIRDPNDNNVIGKKSEFCRRIGAVCLIDDELANILDCAEAGIRCLLFGDYPWNQAEQLPKGVTRVKDWNEVLRALL